MEYVPALSKHLLIERPLANVVLSLSVHTIFCKVLVLWQVKFTHTGTQFESLSVVGE